MPAMRILAPAASYFAIVFSAGFVLGVMRVLWLAPRIGPRAAEFAEMPLMILVCYFAARTVVRRHQVPRASATRLAIGFIALVFLLSVELTMVLWMQGITVLEYIATRDPLSGAVYVASLVLYALMPAVMSKRPHFLANGMGENAR